MTILYINTGTGPNAGNGDTLRTAFNKINYNFSQLSSGAFSTGTNTGSSYNQGLNTYDIPHFAGIDINGTATVDNFATTGTVDTRVLTVSDTATVNLLLVTTASISKATISNLTAVNLTVTNTATLAHAVIPLATVVCADITTASVTNLLASTATITTGTVNNLTVDSITYTRTPTIPNLVVSNTATLNNVLATGTVFAQIFTTTDLTVTGNSSFHNILPATNNLYNVGSIAKQWKNIYTKDSLYINGVALTTTGSNLLVNGLPVTRIATTTQTGYVSVGHNLTITVEGTLTSIQSIVESNPPYNAVVGDQWFDAIGGKNYVFYDGYWVESNVAGLGELGPRGPSGPVGQRGRTGDQGVSVTLQGTKATIADLPATGQPGDGWIVTTGNPGAGHLNGSLWFWNLTDNVWNDVGPIVGPQGDVGDTGQTGPTGPGGPSGPRGYTGGPGPSGPQGAIGPSGTNPLPANGDGFLYNNGSGVLTWADLTNFNIELNKLKNNGYELVFGTDGTLTFPDQTVQTTAFINGTSWNLTSQGNGCPIDVTLTTTTFDVQVPRNHLFFRDDGSWDIGSYVNETYITGDTSGGNGIALTTDRGTVFFGNNPEQCTPTAASHFHIMKQDPTLVDLFFGDDFNYVKLPTTGGVSVQAFNTSTYSPANWTFDTDGILKFPGETGYQATFGSVAPIGDILHSVNSLYLESEGNVSLTSGGGAGLLENINVSDVDELVPPGGVWRLFIDATDYPNLGATLERIGTGTVTTAWGTPITAMITGIDLVDGDWQIQVDQDITAGFDAGPKVVTFGVLSQTYTFGQYGLSFPQGSIFGTGLDNDEFILDSAGNKSFSIFTYGGPDTYRWKFGADGTTTFPNNTLDAGTSTIAIKSTVGAELEYINDNFQELPNEVFNAYVGVDDNGPYMVNLAINSDDTDANFSTWSVDNKGNLVTSIVHEISTSTDVGDIVDIDGNSIIYTIASETPPTRAPNGRLWYNSVEGRMYIRYTDLWVDASPTVIPPISTYLEGLTIEDTTISAVNNTGTVSIATGVTNQWTFDTDGNLTLPTGGSIYGISIIGGEGTNVQADHATEQVYIRSYNTQTQTQNEWTFGTDGALTVAKDIVVGNNNGHIYIDDDLAGASSIRWVNMNPSSAMLRVWSDGRNDLNNQRLELGYDIGGGLYITTTQNVDGLYNNPGDDFNWTFGTDGTLTLPGGSGVAGGFIYGAPGEGAGVSNGGTGYQQFFVQGDGAYVQTSVNNSGTVFNTWQFGTDGKLVFPNNSTFDGQTLTDHATGVNYTLKIANGGVAGSVFGIGTGSAAFGIANDALNHAEDGYVPYSVTAQRINLTALGGGSWVFGADGNLNAPGNVSISGSFINNDDGYLSLRGSSVGPTSRIHIRNQDGDPTSDVNVHLQTGGAGNVFEMFQLSGGAPVPYTSGLRTNSLTAPILIQTNNGGTSTSTWTFAADGSLTLPTGSVIGETNNTTVITPPTANIGQSLVIRPTSTFNLSASGYIVPGQNLTITLTNTNNAAVDNTYINYTITDAAASQLGLTSLTGHFPYLSPSATNPQSASIVLPIPLNSSATTFTLTIDYDQPGGSAYTTITVTSNGIVNNEPSHVHLIAGNTQYVDLYLGDDDQYVKIERDHGNVVIGTNTNTNHWTFGTDGSFTAPGPIYGGSNTIGLATPAPLNLNNTGPIGQVKTQLNLINTAGNAGTGSAVDYFTYVDQGNGLPGARLQAVDDNAYSANFSIALKGKGNAGNNGLTTVWTFGSDGSLTLPGLLQAPQRTIATSTATGVLGQICWDDNNIYVYTSTGWKKSALTSL